MKRSMREKKNKAAEECVKTERSCGDGADPESQTAKDASVRLEDGADARNAEIDPNAKETRPKLTAAEKVRKGFSIALDVLMYLFLAAAVFIVVMVISSSKYSDGAINMFGYEMRIIASSSMEKSSHSVNVDKYDIKDLKVKSMVFIERKPEKESEQNAWYGKLKVGDVLTFAYYEGLSQNVITHRIVSIDKTRSGGYKISLQGDNRTVDKDGNVVDVKTQTIYTSPDDYTSDRDRFGYIIGKVVGNSTFIGYVVYAVRQPVGMILIVIVPCTIIIIWQIVRVILVFSEDKKNKQKVALESAEQQAERECAEREKQARELDELRRRVAELEGAPASDPRNEETKAKGDCESNNAR